MFHRTSVKETARSAKKDIGKSQRELQREQLRLEGEERKLIAEIKKQAKSSNDSHVKILARQLVDTRKAKEKLMEMNAHLGAVKTKTTMLAATETQVNALKSVNKAMVAAGKSMDVQKFRRIWQNFK